MKYFISVVIQGDIQSLNYIIDSLIFDESLVMYSTFIKNIVENENIEIEKIKEEDSIYIEEENKYYSQFSLEAQLETKDPKKICSLIKQDREHINKYLQRYLDSEIDIYLAIKPLLFKEDSYFNL